MTLGRTKNGVILSEVEGSRHALSLRWCVTTAAIACLLSLVCLSACTDYVEQMKDDFDDWEAERALESSAALVAASASSDSALASRRGIKESFSSLDELDVRVYAYQYDLYGLDFLHLYVENNEEDNLDSLTLRLYLEALPEEIEKCATVVDVDICQKYDSTGFSKPCERVDDLRVLMRYSLPMRLDNLKKSGESRYTYYIPVPLGILESHTRVRLDIGFSSGISNDGYKSCETMRTTAKKRMSATSGDWSWSPHVAAEDGADYAGMPLEDIDYGDFVDNVIPVNPYVVVTRNEQYISGISPSFAGKKAFSSSSSSAKSSSSEKLSSSSVTLKSSSSSKVTELVEVTVGSITDSRDGLTYKTVTIGSQTWMAENLNYETAASYCYNDDATNCTKYGRLYTWTAATMACPSGWHLPSKAEWETLFNAVGGQLTAGKVLKSTSGWINSDNGTDAFGFSALLAGYRYDGGFYDNGGDIAYFWSSTEDDSDNAYDMSLYYNYDNAYLYKFNKYYGFSVRCLQDDASGQTERSSSSKTEKFSSSSAKSNSSEKLSSSSVTPKSSSSNSSTKSSSSSVVIPGSIGNLTDTRDGQTYKTVKIGEQVWMAENLNYETAASYCYNDDATNCTKYGRLYTWIAASSACPDDWHLPSEDEWETLFTNVGGQSTAGKVLKFTSGWIESGNGTDSLGFSALPAGYRDMNGNYNLEGERADFWSSTELNSRNAYVMYLLYYDDAAYLDNFNKNYGFFVRCLQD